MRLRATKLTLVALQLQVGLRYQVGKAAVLLQPGVYRQWAAPSARGWAHRQAAVKLPAVALPRLARYAQKGPLYGAS